MPTILRIPLLATLLLPMGNAATAAAPAPDAIQTAAPTATGLLVHVGRDPLMVLSFSLDSMASPEDLLALLGRFGMQDRGERLAAALAQLEKSVGISLKDDLLARLGPEVTLVLDLPPIDQAVLALQASASEAVPVALGQVGLLVRTRQDKKVDRTLRRVLEHLGGPATEVDGIVRVDVPYAAAGAASSAADRVAIYYGIREGKLALGFESEWVRSTLAGPPVGRRLIDGDDYARVFGHLDARPSRLTYVNLPKIRARLLESRVIGMFLAGQPEVRRFVEALVADPMMSIGMGATSVPADGGVRTASFGPGWVSGAAMSAGLVAATALPSLLQAVDSGRSRRTAVDIHTIGEACEGFSADARGYPGPTEGWVPVERIAAHLEPIYVGSLPRVDAWQNPILYWSNGTSYRVASTGKDGLMDRDWSATLEPLGTDDATGDIVYGDGRFLVSPVAR